jgi:hypothetical protein
VEPLCDLPVSGSSAGSVLLFGTLAIITGVAVLAVHRRLRGGRTVPLVIVAVIGAAVVAAVPALQATAADDRQPVASARSGCASTTTSPGSSVNETAATEAGSTPDDSASALGVAGDGDPPNGTATPPSTERSAIDVSATAQTPAATRPSTTERTVTTQPRPTATQTPTSPVAIGPVTAVATTRPSTTSTTSTQPPTSLMETTTSYDDGGGPVVAVLTIDDPASTTTTTMPASTSTTTTTTTTSTPTTSSTTTTTTSVS